MKKKILIIATNALLLIAFIVCLVISGTIRGTLRSQQAAKAWAGQSGERFAQLSVFIPESSVFGDEAIFNLRNSIDRELTAASLEEHGGRKLYTDAWSAVGEASIAGERGTASAKVIGVGGDFFIFHPLYLRDGSYLYPNDVMKDRVVLDEELAWRLFGSVRVAGFEILVNNKQHTIAGVVSRESDFASSKAYTDGAGMFMSYESLMEMSDSNAKINCYEIVMSDPITGFALKTLTDSFPDDKARIIENSRRFSLGSTFDTIGTFGERSMRTDGIMYPYWENAARYAEDWLALLLVLSLIFIVYPAVWGVIYGVKIIRFIIKHGKYTVHKIIENLDKREYEKYMKEHKEEFAEYAVNAGKTGDGSLSYSEHAENAEYNVNDIIREVREGE